MNKQVDFVSIGEYQVSVAMIDGKFRVQVDGLGADGQGSEYERDLGITEIDITVGTIIERDVWAKEEAISDAREAQDRLDNPEYYKDYDKVEIEVSLHDIFGDVLLDVPTV